MSDKPNVKPDSVETLQAALREFARERDWEQFHAPKNLATALAVEAAELLEVFQWLTEEQSRELTPARLDAARMEMADVFLYLLQLADKLNVDLVEAGRRKMEDNASRYPVDRARGNSAKYNEL